MKGNHRRVIRYLCCALLVACAPSALSQETAVGEVAAHLAQIIARSRKPAMSRSPVIVFDFSETGGEFTELGVVLADQLSQSLAAKAQGFEVLERTEFRKSLTIQRIKPASLQDKAAAQCSADSAGADFFLTGTVTPTGDTVLLRLRLVRANDGKEIGEISQLLPLAHELLELVGKSVLPLPSVSLSDSPLLRPGRNGISVPSCEYCPNPSYTQVARHAKLSASVILSVIISAEGRVKNLLPVSGAPCGLTDQAIAAVRTWRFKPATGPNGKPVAVTTEIEVLFRIL